MKRIFVVACFVLCLALSSHAQAARQYSQEFYVFDENGYALGSWTYPCQGGIYIEGTIEGASIIEGSILACQTAGGPGEGNCSAHFTTGLGWEGARLECMKVINTHEG